MFALRKITYEELNARQKENYNFHKISAVLADYGFTTQRLSDDWKGADFIAQHLDGENILKVQLKSRLYFGKKYRNKNLYIAFREADQWYLYPHDELFRKVQARSKFTLSKAWKKDNGEYHYPAVPANVRPLLKRYARGQI